MDFLQRLAASALADTPRLRPALPSRFERVEAPWVPPAPPGADQAPASAAPPAPTSGAPPGAAWPAGRGVKPAVDGSSPEPVGPGSTWLAAPQGASLPGPATRMGEPWPAAPVDTPAVRTHLQAGLFGREPLGVHVAALAAEQAAALRSVPVDPLESVTAQPPVVPPAEPPAWPLTSAPLSPAAVAQQRDGAARLEAVHGAAPRPVVHVTIDRIDVRVPAAAPTVPAASATRARPKGPAVSLTDYLRGGARARGSSS